MKEGQSRIAALDGLRGLAAIAVIAGHTIYNAGTIGNFGVDVFLVHSGWLNGRILLGGENLWTYYRKRAFRILPLYYAVIVILLLTSKIHPRLWPALLLTPWVNNVLSGDDLPLGWGPLWTLGVELHCYLLLPFAVRQKRALWTLVATACVARLAVLAASLIVIDSMPLWPARVLETVAYTATPCRWDAIALGALAVWWQSERPAVVEWFLRWWPWLLVGRLALVPVNWRSMWTPQVLTPVGTVAALGLLFAGLGGRLGAMEWRPLQWCGQRCLGIYLLHPLALRMLPRLRDVWQFEAALAITLVLAGISWRAYELPMQRLGAALERLMANYGFPFGRSPSPASPSTRPDTP